MFNNIKIENNEKKFIPNRLIGEDLIRAINALSKSDPELTQQKIALATGYYSINENGVKIPEPLELINAIVQYKISQKYTTKRGAKPKHELVVQKSNKLIIGKCYLEEAGIRPGTKVKIIIMDRGKIMIQPSQLTKNK